MTNALIISLIVLFLHSCSWQGMIFEGIKKLIKPEGMLYKPIYGCPICMTPYYGTIIYWIFFQVSFPNYLLTVGAASGLSVLYVCAIDFKDYLKELKDASKKITQ